jgi:hypothetical protein
MVIAIWNAEALDRYSRIFRKTKHRKAHQGCRSLVFSRGLYTGKYPPGGGGTNVIWGKKYEKVKRKRGKI